MKILINHLGYDPTSPKHAVVQGQANDTIETFKIINEDTGETTFTGTPCHIGPVQRWKDWQFWTIDFDELHQEGNYHIECPSPAGTISSYPFRIQPDVLERGTISDLIYYFKGQRCSGPNDQADRSMTFVPSRGITVDVHGGWYDASGDYGKHLSLLSDTSFFNPQQIPLVVWSLLKSYEALERKKNPNFRQYQRRLLDEALFGADYLVRIKEPMGSFYNTVFGMGPDKKPEERRIIPQLKAYSLMEEAHKYGDSLKNEHCTAEAFGSSFRSGGGLAIAGLALASSHGMAGDFSSADYLKTAEEAFAYLETYNLELTNDHKENIVDDYCILLAAVELYRATHQETYHTAAQKRAKSLMDRLTASDSYRDYWRADDGERPFFHPVDAGLPVISLLSYLEIAVPEDRQPILDTVHRSFIFEFSITEGGPNPFGYSRQLVQQKSGDRRVSFFFPHDTETAPWWQGENARLGSLATAARMAAPYFRKDEAFFQKLEAFATNQLNWIMGLNPFDLCMLDGTGRNNPDYLFHQSWEYTNSPGGICNGITSGFHDEEDIDFHLCFAQTGSDNDWRWVEQWLPHAAWFLLAVATGGGL